VIFSEEYLARLSSKTGFHVENLEKLSYLIRILHNIVEHPFLKPRLALKGGTAINLFYFELPRLSVDIDVNYIGSSERQRMLDEKGEVEEALRRILESLKLEVRRVPEEHAGGKWRLSFQSVFGGTRSLELDINYLMRVPFFPVVMRESFVPDINIRVKVPIVSFEEAFAGKIVALMARTSSRDLYDVYQLSQFRGGYDLVKLKKATMIVGASGRMDWREVSSDQIDEISEDDISRELLPLLPVGEEPDPHELKRVSISFLRDLLSYDPRECEFMDCLVEKGEYRVELLFL
jgi:predicted nucleotidyltransferase component of viral defense system